MIIAIVIINIIIIIIIIIIIFIITIDLYNAPSQWFNGIKYSRNIYQKPTKTIIRQ